jgi:hypothetical protein
MLSTWRLVARPSMTLGNVRELGVRSLVLAHTVLSDHRFAVNEICAIYSVINFQA